MAERRMFTKKVTDDDNFMSLSSSAQALYLHLSMSADDDGFCNQVNTAMFKAHASIQDLQALLEKRYIYQFECGVIVIKHWRMHNYIQKDRYKPTNYQEEKSMLELEKNGSYTFVNEMDTTWTQNGYNLDTQDRLGKVSIDKDSIDNTRVTRDTKPTTNEDVKKVLELWNSIDGLTHIRDIKGTRLRHLNNRIAEEGIDAVIEVIENVAKSDFLKGNNKNGWRATFDWIILPSNFSKALEGNYNSKSNEQSFDDELARWLNDR